MLTEELLQKSLTQEYWLTLCPELSINDDLLSIKYVFHWGSRSSHWAKQPRINYSMYVQRADVKPLDDLAINLNGNNNFKLTFEMRLGLICRSLWQYKDTNDLALGDILIEFAKNNHTLLDGRGYQKTDIARNDPCWCGSGKRFKHCHGASS